MTGQAIAVRLAMPRSIVGAMLRKLDLGQLSALEVRPAIIRYSARSQPVGWHQAGGRSAPSSLQVQA